MGTGTGRGTLRVFPETFFFSFWLSTLFTNELAHCQGRFEVAYSIPRIFPITIAPRFRQP